MTNSGTKRIIPKWLQNLLWAAAGLSAVVAISTTVLKGYSWLHNLEHQEEITRENKADIVKLQEAQERYKVDSIRIDKQVKLIIKNQKLDSSVVYFNYYWVKRWNGR